MDINIYKDAVAKISEENRLDFVVLFGSQATGRTTKDSDVDIAVSSKGPLDIIKITGLFQEIFKCEDIHLIDIGKASPILMRQIILEGKLIYEKTVGQYLVWKLYAMRVWMETAWLRELGKKKLLEWSV